jgi:anaerobic carbon-monoxide dehydrogenase iron sulfur subunit
LPVSRLIVDRQACNGCGDCVSACLKQLRERPAREKADPVSRITVSPGESGYTLSICRQCRKAGCIGVCPIEALYQDEASHSVQFDEEACITCGVCQRGCPFGAIQLSEKRQPLKCDLCLDLAQPPCAAACQSGALQVRAVSEFSQERRHRTARRRLPFVENSRPGHPASPARP